ncbi:MAG TPA: nitroreductase family protein [Bryobacteraceae bacterium]|nr:nitroreductase family protein [Bryobacteraceae bacterium]
MPQPSPLHRVIANRWSPRAFRDQSIDHATLRSLFEAARWAASCFNEQPWRFVIATKEHPEQFERVLATLVPKNQDWAKTAYALGISAGKKTFSHNNAPNRFGLHDAGAALANLMIQATAVGLHVHGMGGFDAAKARVEFGIPDDYEVGAAFAIGYVDGDPDPPKGRSRRPLEETVFGTEWGKTSASIEP